MEDKRNFNSDWTSLLDFLNLSRTKSSSKLFGVKNLIRYVWDIPEHRNGIQKVTITSGSLFILLGVFKLYESTLHYWVG